MRHSTSPLRWLALLGNLLLLCALALSACSREDTTTKTSTTNEPIATQKPTLPGQAIWKDGTSSYVFGTNDAIEWSPHNFQTQPAIQDTLKAGGFTLVRTYFQDTSSDVEIDKRVGAIERSGAQCLGVLANIFNEKFNTHLVQYLGNRCQIYEVGNEPDYYEPRIDPGVYVKQWSDLVVKLRRVNPQAKFLGPSISNLDVGELGRASRHTGYINTFLNGVKASAVFPDAISFHWYPCWQDSEDACLKKAGTIEQVVQELRAKIKEKLDHDVPIAVTEWNFDPGSPPPSYGEKADFITKFSKDALEAMIRAKVTIACQYAAASYTGYGGLDMFNVDTSQPKPQFYAIKSVIDAYKPANSPTTSTDTNGTTHGDGVLVSQGKPAVCGNNTSPTGAQVLTDGKYGNWGYWQATPQSLPSWCALHLDKGPSKLLFIWFSDYQFDYITNKGSAPQDYTISVSADSTDGQDGHWRTLATVSGNQARVREHLLDFAGQSWVKMTATKLSPLPLRNDLEIDELEAYDVSQSTNDTFIFSGDSITGMAYNRYPENQPSFSLNVHNAYSQRYPAMLDAGLGGWSSQGAVEHIDEWLKLNPDIHYWLLQWGSNDALEAVSPERYEANMRQVVQKIKGAGHIPILAHITPVNMAGDRGTQVNQKIEAYNRAIDKITRENGLISGPDLYALFQPNKATYLLKDGLHPTAAGAIAMNKAWFEVVRDAIYKKS
ncbi:SGNH/GDSL hydrolase family protein [Ktedonospora formicarum]|uniref:SGNH hydrolase-type esterase domain-containing protein n=1 Tax=Ktedonospora formicarum TaxID=2778364 RepID=A0A8J3HWH0_9CHLR|nr:GDSL-type esterase/lipase family protein [Ktedonospora formicarum]GHO43291.1 hypothetical protein KSX_14540 [Ktedonospora formicarum]